MKSPTLIIIAVIIILLGSIIAYNFYQKRYTKPLSIEIFRAEDLKVMTDQKITLVGIAKDLKASAVIAGKDTNVYIFELSSWSEEYLNKKISVTGTLKWHKYSPPIDGIIRQEIIGDYFYISNASWSLLE